MPLLQTTLKMGLMQMEATNSEIQAIQTFVQVYINYLSSATAGPVPIIPLALNTGPKAAAIGTLQGFSMDSAGAAQISGALNAFWGAMSPIAVTLFPTALSITPPPTLGLLATLLPGIFIGLTQGGATLESCADAIATAIHSNSQGGIAIFPPPPGGLGPQPIT